MDSRKSELPLRIILDIPPLKNEHNERIQQYGDNELFEFLAIGGPSRFTEVKIDFIGKITYPLVERAGKGLL